MSSCVGLHVTDVVSETVCTTKSLNTNSLYFKVLRLYVITHELMCWFTCYWCIGVHVWANMHKQICCSEFQWVAVSCSELQCVAMSCGACACACADVLVTCIGTYVAASCCELRWGVQRTATHGNTLQRTATHCNTLQHTATHCNTLQHTATHCNTVKNTAPRCTTLHHTAPHRWYHECS